MVLKLYGSPFSTCTRRVATVLHEKDVPFELVEVDLRQGAHKAPAFLEKQPFGQIPYIVRELLDVECINITTKSSLLQDDDGFILYESRAICRYICAKYPNQGTSLVPTDLKANALFEQAVSIEGSNFDPYASAAVAEMIFKPYV